MLTGPCRLPLLEYWRLPTTSGSFMAALLPCLLDCLLIGSFWRTRSDRRRSMTGILDLAEKLLRINQIKSKRMRFDWIMDCEPGGSIAYYKAKAKKVSDFSPIIPAIAPTPTSISGLNCRGFLIPLDISHVNFASEKGQQTYFDDGGYGSRPSRNIGFYVQRLLPEINCRSISFVYLRRFVISVRGSLVISATVYVRR